jgi:aspartyl-tRNA(Asn)/glutamyl-tRNA(Gln) amidotransferase subunit C
MKISNKDIEHLAHLARLELTDKETNQYRREISGIVRYVDHLASANVDRQTATARLSKIDNVLRPDSVAPWDNDERAAALKQATRRSGKYISVPRVLE